MFQTIVAKLHPRWVSSGPGMLMLAPARRPNRRHITDIQVAEVGDRLGATSSDISTAGVSPGPTINFFRSRYSDGRSAMEWGVLRQRNDCGPSPVAVFGTSNFEAWLVGQAVEALLQGRVGRLRFSYFVGRTSSRDWG